MYMLWWFKVLNFPIRCPFLAGQLSRRSNVDLKDKFRNIQLSMNRFGYTFKKEKDGLGPPGHDYGTPIHRVAYGLIDSSPFLNVDLPSQGVLAKQG